MKAEHRKELHTNALAERMTRLVEGFKSGPKSTSVVLWTLAILIVGTVFAWYYFGGQGPNTGPLWVKLYRDTNLEDLRQVAAQHPGTIPGRTARFQEARELLQAGLESLAGPDRARAIENLASARSTYVQLHLECTDDPVLRQETLLGIAKAEEALVGVPQDQMPRSDIPPGDLKKSIDFYDQFLAKLAKTDPDGALYKSLHKYVENLKTNQEAVVKFYGRLNEEAAKKK